MNPHQNPDSIDQAARHTGPKTVRWVDEWRDFLAFCLRPRLGYRCRQVSPQSAWLLDWLPNIGLGRLLAWAGILWAINIFIFGPIVMSVANQAGASHRVDPENLPWLLALVWAPLVEEILFRYGLRRPAMALWLIPLLVLALWQGVGSAQSMMFVVAVLLIYQLTRQARVPSRYARPWLRLYRHWFGWVFHVSVAAFAVLHIYNFTLTSVAWWMYPLLVLPQWFTGLVLGWIRVNRGIGTAIILHALFNFGPLMVAWLAFRWLKEAGLT